MMKTKREFERHFRDLILPAVKAEYEADGQVDRIARREEWSNYVSLLVEDGELPERALEWDSPW